jgi:hypothetical protein
LGEKSSLGKGVVSCGWIAFWSRVSQVANEPGGLCDVGIKRGSGDGFSGESGLVVGYVIMRRTEMWPGIHEPSLDFHVYDFRPTTKHTNLCEEQET